MDKSQFIMEQLNIASNVSLVVIVMTIVVLLLIKMDHTGDKES